jgi:hypothetical protein
MNFETTELLLTTIIRSYVKGLFFSKGRVGIFMFYFNFILF